jgi:hypothetical protein
MSEDLFSAGEKAQAIAALQAIGTAQQNASLLLRELRGQCKKYCLEGEFLPVMGAFAEAERVVGQELRKLKELSSPLLTPAEAVTRGHEEVQFGDAPVDEAKARVAETRAAWRAEQPDRQLLAANDHSLEERA